MRILAAPDKFRGTATASEAAAAIALAGRSVRARTREVPMSADASQLFLFQQRDKWIPGGPPPGAVKKEQ